MHFYLSATLASARLKLGRGFTLIEFLLVTTITGILISLAAPSFYPLLQSYRVFDTAIQLERGIRHARQQAIMQNSVVRMCPSSDGRYCATENNWSAGHIVFTDLSEDSIRQDTEQLLFTHAPGKQVSVHFNRSQMLSFNGLGRVSTNGTFTICDVAGKAASRQLVIIHSGRIRKTQDSGSCS